MNVSFENIKPDENSSFRTLHNNVPTSELRWEYHYHPEVELVCVVSGHGTRHVGYHKSRFSDGDLVLIGSNVPHSGFGLNSSDPHEELVVQFKEENISFSQEIPEAKKLQKTLEMAKYGICYPSKVKKMVLPKLVELFQLSGFKKYLQLLEILSELSLREDYFLLNSEVMPYTIISKNKERLQNVFTYVEQNYQNEIDVNYVAEIANLTLPAFCNFFKKATEMTFTEFVNRYRINKACLLISQDLAISEACYDCGFNSVSYFNRNFKKFTQKSPTEFKLTFEQFDVK